MSDVFSPQSSEARLKNRLSRQQPSGARLKEKRKDSLFFRSYSTLTIKAPTRRRTNTPLTPTKRVRSLTINVPIRTSVGRRAHENPTNRRQRTEGSIQGAPIRHPAATHPVSGYSGMLVVTTPGRSHSRTSKTASATTAARHECVRTQEKNRFIPTNDTTLDEARHEERATKHHHAVDDDTSRVFDECRPVLPDARYRAPQR